MSRYSWYDELDSTNDEAKRLIRSNAFEGENSVVICAHRQTKGRGQFSRHWYSDDDGGLYYTFIKKNPTRSLLETEQIITVTAHAIKKSIEDHATCHVSLEWPNDLILNGKKVGGILVEAISSEERGTAFIIVGVGLNLNQSEFPDELRHVAISLRQYTGKVYNKTAFAEYITKELEVCL